MGKKNRYYESRRESTEGTIYSILEKFKDVTEEEILNTLYVSTTNDYIKKMSRKIEYMLMDAKVCPNRFSAKLHDFYVELATDIIKSNKIRDFFEYTHHMYCLLEKRTGKEDIVTAYYNLLIQLAVYLCPTGTVPTGITKEGELLTVKEMYPYTDEVVRRVVKETDKFGWGSQKATEVLVSRMRKLGYNVRTTNDVELLFMEENITSNMLFTMSVFIDDLGSVLLQRPFIGPKVPDVVLPRKERPIRETRALLHARKRLLPKAGIYLSGVGSIEEVFLQEKFTMGSVYLLYRLKIGGRYLIGFYSTEKEFFYSTFLDSVNTNTKVLHRALEEFILETYADLTTNIRLARSYQEITTTGTRKLDRDKLVNQVTEVDAYVRRLPTGASASEEAIELAKAYGIQLDKNETFVRPFKKNVLKQKEE